MNRHEFYDSLNKYKANSLTHYGTLGQKWGVRKWQNYDGTFNEAGKERYFGSKNKEDKINDKAEKMTQHMISHPVLYNSKGIPEEDIRKYFKAFYSTPMLLRSTYNVNNKYREMYGEDPNRKLDFNMRTMEQNSYAQNARTAIPLGSMEGSKVKSKYQNPDGSLTKKGEKLYNSKNPLTRMNAEKLINQDLLNEYSFNKKKEEHANHMNELEKMAKDDPAYNGNLYEYEKDYYYMHPEKNINNDQKIGSTYSPNGNWHNPTQEEYDKIANEMKEYGWTVKRNTSDSFNPIHCYKPIKNEEYKGKDYEINDLPFHSKDSKTINKIAEDDLKFLNTKGSLNKVMNNFIDYEWKYYQDYAKENEYKPMSKTEFAKMAKQNVIFDSVGLNSGNAMSMMFDTNYDNKYDEDDQHNYFKQVYDVFQINVDPKTGNISNFYIV